VDIPVLGVGTLHAPGLESVFEAGSELIDVVEIEPQLRREPDGRYRLREDVFAPAMAVDAPKLIHGVGFPVAGTLRPRAADLEPYLEAVRRSGAPWASEHLSFNEACDDGRGYFGGFLLPPVQSPESVRTAARNIRALKSLLSVPFAFETGVIYFRRLPAELTDGAFFAAVAEEADCGILLDLHNLWCNERNGLQRVLDAVAELPLDRVWEVHLAGGTEVDGLWLDSHSGPPPEPLYELAEQVLPLLPNLGAVIFEITPEIVGRGRVAAETVLDQLRRVRAIWERTAAARAERVGHRQRPQARPAITVATAPDPALPSPERWETAVAALAASLPARCDGVL
jgi:uncharacterized protein (UPF0276 family)